MHGLNRIVKMIFQLLGFPHKSTLMRLINSQKILILICMKKEIQSLNVNFISLNKFSLETHH